MATKPKFTPGPWIFYADVPSTDPNWHIVTTENRMRILANVHIEPGNAMDDANARLIAAGPDLYAALLELREAIMDGLCNGGTPAFDGPQRLDNAIAAADAAHAKAVSP